MTKHILPISVTGLELDQDNPRFENDPAKNQRDAIKKMLDIKGMPNKIATMAEHIVTHGIDPSDLPLAIRNTKNKKHILLEGNRRLLALKLLHNPALCPSDHDPLKKKLQNILQESDVVPEEIQCSIVQSRKHANLWIELKHTGENAGAGRVNWDGRATDAFREKNSQGKTAGRVILEYIGNDPNFDKALKEYAKAVKITNLQRLFGSLETKKRLGYKISKGNLLLQVPIEKFRKGVESIIQRFHEDNVAVSDIYDKEKIKTFLTKRVAPECMPTKSDLVGEYIPLGDAQKNDKPKPSKKPSTSKGTKSISPSNLRKHLITYSLRITHKRINAIYHELRSKIDIQEAPNAGAVLFRVFLELTADYALKELKLDNKKSVKNDILRKKITTVTDKLMGLGKLTPKEGQDIKTSADDNTNLYCSIDSLHRYIHGVNHPVARELNDIADNWAPFFKAVWSYNQDLGN